MIASFHQLPLPLDHKSKFIAADFFPTKGSRLALEWLDKSRFWAGGRLVLWGAAGSGKSHLLHVWASAYGISVMTGSELRGVQHAISGPVAVDDTDFIADEISLFHLLNCAAEAGHPVLLAARQPPSRLAIALPDLSSRLRASTTVEIFPPDDGERAALLARLAASRQLILNKQVQNFLLTHLPRTSAALIEAITRLDRAALANGARISRSLAASLLKDISREDQEGQEMLSNRHSQDTPNLL